MMAPEDERRMPETELQTIPDGSRDSEPRRLKTRRKIRDAAQKCFLDRGVTATSVDEIVTAAKLSRATFYLHYNSKDAVLIDLLQEQHEPLMRIFTRLRDMAEPSVPAVRDWLAHYVAAVRAHRGHLNLYSLGQVFDAEARALVVRQRQQIIGILGQRYPGFQLKSGDDQHGVECLLTMFQLEQTVSALVHGGVMPDDDIALNVMARRMLDFLLS